MHLSLTDYLLWLASPLFQMGVVVALFRRGLHKEYPYFYTYTILSVLGIAFLLCVQGSPYLYFWGYWVSAAISVVISFAVLWEVFKEALRPYEALRDFSVILFRWAALVVVLVGGMWAITTIHSNGREPMITFILLTDRSVRLMQCALVFFILLSSEYVGISRRHVSYGIALGFGVFASVNMLVGVVHADLRRISWAADDVAALIWLGYAVLAPSQ